MDEKHEASPQYAPRAAPGLLDVLIRAGLILAMAVACYQIFAPFISLMTWAVILAVTLYPMQQYLAAKMGGRQGLASTLLVVLGFTLLIVPTGVLMSSLGDSVEKVVTNIQNHTIEVPPPREAVAKIPLVGDKIFEFWTQAHDDPKALIQSMQPKISDLAKGALAFVASIGGGLLQFLAAIIIAGIIMAFGKSGGESSKAIFERLAGHERGADFARLATSTIRAVAQGVIGVAFIQAIIVGLVLLVAGVPWAGVLAIVVLVLGIAQIPALIVTLPAIGYIWWVGTYGNGEAIFYTILIVVSGMADNVLKPLMLGRGVEAPMPVILLGALGGMAAKGILGMFVGATLLALGYQIFMGWVASNRAAGNPQ